jgi:predicted GNAT family N-acyltransferase
MSDYELKFGRPADFAAQERSEFAVLVKSEGEVIEEGLDGRISEAEVLVFLRSANALIGIAALKNPRATYRQRVARKAQIPLGDKEYPLELGWVVVDESMRRQGHSRTLTECAMRQLSDRGVFATSRKEAMYRTLKRFQFVEAAEYPSDRGDYQIRLFLRKGNQCQK